MPGISRKRLLVGLVVSVATMAGFPAPVRVTAASSTPIPSYSGIPPEDGATLRERTTAAEPVEVSADLLAAQLRLRKALGFDTDADLVRALLEDPGASNGLQSTGGDFAGLTVTPTEADEFATRNYLQTTMHSVNGWLLGSDPSYIETYIEPSKSGASVAVVLFDRQPSQEQADSVLDRIPALLRDRIHLESAPVQRSDLDAAAEELSQLLDSGVIQGDMAVHYRSGEVVLFTSQSDASDALRGLADSNLVRVEQVEAESHPTNNKDVTQPFGLVHSSLELLGDPHNGVLERCTSGFAVNTGFGPMLLTAGHCFLLGSPDGPVTQGTNNNGRAPVGVVAARNYPITPADDPRFDAETISTGTTGRPLWGRIHINTNNWAQRITGWIGTNADSVGDVGCQSGITSSGLSGFSGPNCGVLLERYYRPSDYLPSSCSCFRVFDTISQGGDSGGGIYWDTIYGSLAVALVSGATGGSNIDMISSHLPYIQNEWGLTPMTN